MGSFQHSKRSDSKRCTVEVRRGIFIGNLTVLFVRKNGRKYFHTNSYGFGHDSVAWATCGLRNFRKSDAGTLNYSGE